MANLSLSDFQILKEIYRTGSITASVSQVGLSQPAISVRLRNMRTHFGDPLFVKTSEGMVPTALMQTLISPIERALDLLEPSRGRLVHFAPESSTRRFRLSLSHVAQIVMLPDLLATVERCAPHVLLDSFDLNKESAQAMIQGDIDIAIGYTAELNNGFYQQGICSEYYACIARKEHPRLRELDSLSVAQFLKEEHLSLIGSGTGHSLLEKQLRAEGITRFNKHRISSILGLEQIIIATNLLAIVPARLANILAQGGRVRVFDIPFPTPTYEIRQYWHERYHSDPGHRWLRQVIFDAFVDLPSAKYYSAGKTSRLQPNFF